MTSAVLDSSALLALLNSEPGADIVISALEGALISTVNYAEVIAKLVERGATPERARAAIAAIDIGIADFDRALAERTGALRALTKQLGLSLGDRACIALAERERVPALTSDRRWAGVNCEAEIQMIR
jgi:PIN domain nuclease of toxin-antitoxin system